VAYRWEPSRPFQYSGFHGTATLLNATYLGGLGSAGSLTGLISSSLSIETWGSRSESTAPTMSGWPAQQRRLISRRAGKAATVFQPSNEAEADSGPPATAGFIAELDPTQAGINQFCTGPTSAVAD
jgi:hypothetical protein